MNPKTICRIAAAGVALFSLVGLLRAGEPLPRRPKPPAECVDQFARAGHPEKVACWARPTETKHFGGYYVGGGAACHGEGRYVNEGTWGWDYAGAVLPKRVALGWWHGRREQGGEGAYKTDGPHLLH